MLHVIKKLENLKISNAKEGIGYLKDFYFDDESWVTRYIVVDTGSLFTGRKVLISPNSLKKPNFLESSIYTDLTQKQIEDSPPISKEEPVSHQHEIKLSEYYGWPAYWSMETSMRGAIEATKRELKEKEQEKENDPHLRSIREVRNYRIEAIDGEIGVIDSFIIDDANWIIKYLVIDTRKWLHWLPGGKNILVAPEWIKKIDWENSKVTVDLNKKTIEEGPEFIDVKGIDKEFENRLYNCYKEFVERNIVDVDRTKV